MNEFWWLGTPCVYFGLYQFSIRIFSLWFSFGDSFGAWVALSMVQYWFSYLPVVCLGIATNKNLFFASILDALQDSDSAVKGVCLLFSILVWCLISLSLCICTIELVCNPDWFGGLSVGVKDSLFYQVAESSFWILWSFGLFLSRISEESYTSRAVFVLFRLSFGMYAWCDRRNGCRLMFDFWTGHISTGF